MKKLLLENEAKLKKLVGAEKFAAVDANQDAPVALTSIGSLFIDLSGAVDAEAEGQRLRKERDKLENVARATRARLANQDFVSKAPQKVIDGAKKQLEEVEAKLAEINALIAKLSA